jgi:hypothetical protein
MVARRAALGDEGFETRHAQAVEEIGVLGTVAVFFFVILLVHGRERPAQTLQRPRHPSMPRWGRGRGGAAALSSPVLSHPGAYVRSGGTSERLSVV